MTTCALLFAAATVLVGDAPASPALPSSCSGGSFVNLGGSSQSGVGACGLGVRILTIGTSGSCSADGAGACTEDSSCSADVFIYYRSNCSGATLDFTTAISPSLPVPGGDGSIGSLPFVTAWSIVVDKRGIGVPTNGGITVTAELSLGANTAVGTSLGRCTACGS